jgi:transcriptional regulator with XRE-family HTH domain
MSDLRSRIIEALEKAHMKQIDLAKHAGVSRATVSLWVSGATKTIEGDNLTRAARALGVDAHWLATGEHKSIPLGVGEPESIYGTFNHDEVRLLRSFRSLDDDDRERAITIIEALSKLKPPTRKTS